MKYMKIKIAIISFFISSNIGDLLLSEQLVRSFPDDEIMKIDFPTGTVFSAGTLQPQKNTGDGASSVPQLPDFISALHGFTYSLQNKHRFIDKVATAIKGTQAIILGGGNMVMDIGHFPEYTYRCFLYTEIAKKLNIPIFSLSVGIGPIQNSLQKKYAAKALRRCMKNFVRDEKSAKLCASWKVASTVSGDSAFSYKPAPICQNTSKDYIAVCIAAYTCICQKVSYKEYLRFWIDLIMSLHLAFPKQTICLFSSESSDYPMVNEVYKGCAACNVITVAPINGLDDLLVLYSKSRVAIAMRMHSAIIGMLADVPCVGLSWQSKVDSLFEMCQRTDYLFDLAAHITNTDAIIKACLKLNEYAEQEIQIQKAFVEQQSISYANSVSEIIREIHF